MLVVIALALRREGQIVREHLTPDLHGGRDPTGVPKLGSVLAEWVIRSTLFPVGGFGRWKTARQLNQRLVSWISSQPGCARHNRHRRA